MIYKMSPWHFYAEQALLPVCLALVGLVSGERVLVLGAVGLGLARVATRVITRWFARRAVAALERSQAQQGQVLTFRQRPGPVDIDDVIDSRYDGEEES